MYSFLKLMLVLSLFGNLTVLGVSYNGYQILQVALPSNETELDVITDQYNVNEIGVTHDGRKHLLVAPNVLMNVYQALNSSSIQYEILIDNLQLLIDNQILNDVSNTTLNFDKYNTYDVIKYYLENLEKDLGQAIVRCKTEVIGKTSEENPIYMIRIYKLQKPCHPGKRRPKKQAILIDGGIHAREWISPAFVIYLINQLLKNPNKNHVIDKVLDKFDWYIIPVLNPDGYIYSLKDRLWRKNRRLITTKPKCIGVDLNRNFGHMWNPKIGGSSDPCDYEVYAGPNAFSEKESNALKNVMLRKNNYCAYLSFHSYGQFWLYPWGYAKFIPVDANQLKSVAMFATKALSDVFGTQYTIGSAANALYPAAGVSMDYAKAIANIKYSYTVELRDKGKAGFILPANQIVPTCKETMQGVLAFAQKLVEVKKLE